MTIIYFPQGIDPRRGRFFPDDEDEDFFEEIFEDLGTNNFIDQVDRLLEKEYYDNITY